MEYKWRNEINERNKKDKINREKGEDREVRKRGNKNRGRNLRKKE
jgi:hypothetical protein